jgi:PUA-domain protein
MSRRRLSKSDLKELSQGLQRFSLELSKHDTVEVVEDSLGTSYAVNGETWLFDLDGSLVPHLRLLLARPATLKRITVDMGAVKFVTNGADVMRPGVVGIEDGIGRGDLVVVVDQQHGKPLAVGEALLDSTAMLAAAAGKVVRTLHHVGDKRWSGTTTEK